MSHTYFGKEILKPANPSSYFVNKNIYTFNFETENRLQDSMSKVKHC